MGYERISRTVRATCDQCGKTEDIVSHYSADTISAPWFEFVPPHVYPPNADGKLVCSPTCAVAMSTEAIRRIVQAYVPV